MHVLGARGVVGRESGDSSFSSPSRRPSLPRGAWTRQTAGVESYSTQRYSLSIRVRVFGLKIGNMSIEHASKMYQANARKQHLEHMLVLLRWFLQELIKAGVKMNHSVKF